MKIKKPCGHRVVVKLKPVEEKTKGGIVISTSDNLKRAQYGVEEAYVEQIGKTAFKAFDDGEPWCEVGDLVAITKYSGKDYEDGEDIYRVINDDDIMAVLEEPKDEEVK